MIEKLPPTGPEPYQLSSQAALKAYGSRSAGLNSEEAAIILQRDGANSLQKLKKTPVIVRFFRQFKDLMLLLLLACALLALYLQDYRTGFILICIIIINSLIGFAQEYKAEKIMDSLEALMVSEAKVYRGGKLTDIDAEQLVVGDIIYVEEGDSVPADARIIDETELSTNDFALTGESNPSRKFTHAIEGKATVGNRHNLVFMGTTVATGNARCLVVATGMKTELGRIASLSQTTKSGLSPLQKEMNNLASRITAATLILAAILVAITMSAGLSPTEAMIFAIGIASAMIPQGLPAEVSVSLAQAANKLAKEKALVKQLSAVETLGATSIICTDKTGTLTKNEMTVEQLIFADTYYGVTGSGYEPVGTIQTADGQTPSKAELASLEKFVVTGLFATNATVCEPDATHPNWYCLGDPTEGALVTLAKKLGLDTAEISQTIREIKEFPFDSVRKRMSSVRVYEKQLTVFVKGAPESVLAKCDRIWLSDGTIRKITEADRQLIENQNTANAQKAMRNLAYAYKELDDKTDYEQHDPNVVENKLIYMGLVSMIDPVREEVKGAMEAARQAGIKVSIITGDFAPTAKAIAVRAKLADKPEDIIIIEGEKLPTMSDDEVLKLVLRGSVLFSRVSPEDKLRIVGLAKDNGHVVAVTGDGINDAPALKRADIGVAMGKTGTDVAKQSAEIILLDDSFHTLIGAIQQGRTVFQNIKTATMACLTSNFGELATVLLGLAAVSLTGIPPAITPVLILAVDLIAELFPIAALGWDKPEQTLMNDAPRRPEDHIYNRAAFTDLALSGLLIGILAFGNYLYFAHRNGIDPTQLAQSDIYPSAITLTYVTIVVCQLFNIFMRRTRGATLVRYQFSNIRLWLATGLSIACVTLIVYAPFIQHIFGSGPLSATDLSMAVFAGIVFFAIIEPTKLIRERLRLRRAPKTEMATAA